MISTGICHNYNTSGILTFKNNSTIIMPVIKIDLIKFTVRDAIAMRLRDLNPTQHYYPIHSFIPGLELPCAVEADHLLPAQGPTGGMWGCVCVCLSINNNLHNTNNNLFYPFPIPHPFRSSVWLEFRSEVLGDLRARWSSWLWTTAFSIPPHFMVDSQLYSGSWMAPGFSNLRHGYSDGAWIITFLSSQIITPWVETSFRSTVTSLFLNPNAKALFHAWVYIWQGGNLSKFRTRK